ncbi:MAG TPA: hypothetical protein PJ991_08955 [Kiritimatiellia bacterium]|nr:hypothetical protein [Kiritimatiellia bacterium]
MKKVAMKAVAAAALLAVVSSPAVRAAEATVGVDVLSAYVWRGATLNENFVAQPYVDISGLPIDIGIWANFDIESDRSRGITDSQFSEVNFVLGYTLPIEAVDVGVVYTEYVYPNGGEADREIGLTLGLDLPLSPSLGLYYGLDGAAEDSFYGELGIGHELELDEGLTLNLEALVGYWDLDGGENGFSHYQLTASLTFDFVTVGVSYIDQLKKKVLGDAYDVDVLGFVSLSHSF